MADRPVDTVAQREMWDEWWYDQFEIPNDIPDSFRRFEIEIDGEVCVGALLETAAPRTCDAYWGHDADRRPHHPLRLLRPRGVLSRPRRHGAGARLRAGEPADPDGPPATSSGTPGSRRLPSPTAATPGCASPTTLWYGDTPHPNQGCIFARIVENLDGFARLCKSLRYEGTKRMVTRQRA